jgi:hypothetical protein
MKENIYWSCIEFHYKQRPQTKENTNLKGGFVYAFIKAFDVRDALDMIIISLKKNKLQPIEIEYIKPYEKNIQWESKKQTKHYLELYKEAKRTDEVIFDDLYAYEKQ